LAFEISRDRAGGFWPLDCQMKETHSFMLAACLCFRDSSAYLHEWLLFHWVQGIERFYLFDNESVDDFQRVLRPWIEASIVSLRSWPGRGQQQAIYDHCLSITPPEIDWLAFIDDDEFLFNPDGEPLPKVLAPFQAHAGVAVSWALYGSSDVVKQTDEWVIERFVRRAPGPDPHVKCIVNPQRVLRSRVIGHMFEVRPGFQIVDERGRPVAEPRHEDPSISRLRINHYLVKSWEEFARRRARPQANTGIPTPHTLAQWREWDRTWSEVEDPIARQFVPRMHEAQRSLFGR
jgi:hypothetical protein